MENLQWGYLDPADYDEAERLTLLSGLTDVVVVTQLANHGSDTTLRPLTLDLMNLNHQYLGGTRWQSDLAPDQNGNHIRPHLTNVTGLDKSPATYDQMASIGVVYAISYDPDKVHYPQLRTLSTQRTLKSHMYFNFALAEVMHVNYQVWCQLTGRNLQDDQLTTLHRSRAMYALREVLDSRYSIQFDVDVTPADVARGNSWTSSVAIIGKMPRLVKKLTLSV